MEKLFWLYHRLRAMSIEEVLYRIQQKGNRHVNKLKYKQDRLVTEKKYISSIQNNEFLNRIDLLIKNDTDNLSSSIEGYEVFTSLLNILEDIDWHKGIHGNWPSDKYSNSISFKNQDDIGEIRYTWEVNRHQFLPLMAKSYLDTGDKEIKKRIINHFYDWSIANPMLKGVNWTSSMEIAIRAYQWLIVLTLLKEEKDEGDKEFHIDLTNAIIASIEYVMNNLSLHSSANNHLILEVAISSIIGYCIEPIYKQQWFEEGYKVLEEQIPLQFFRDGVNQEQAVHYHAFVLDMMLQYNFYLRKISYPTLHDQYLYNATKFLGYLSLGGTVTEFGDSDDAKILYVDQYSNYYDYILQLSSVYFDIKFYEYENVINQVKMVAGNYFRNDIEKSFDYEEFFVFQEGGYAFFNIKNSYVAFDFGPLGFGSIAAHGHADALSFVYNINKTSILTDPGTYIYNVQSKWRDYFRKTSSHNTLSIGEIDQSTMKGPFLWSKKAKSELIDFGNNNEIAYVVASHNGYEPHIHKRALTFIKKYNLLVVADYFTEKADLNYIFDPGVTLNTQNSKEVKLNEDIYMYFSEVVSIADKYSSKKFMEKISTTGIKMTHNFRENRVAYTLISDKQFSITDNRITYGNIVLVYDNYKEIRGL